jgi:hypothetical protein
MRSIGREVLLRKHYIFIPLTFSIPSSNTPPRCTTHTMCTRAHRSDATLCYVANLVHTNPTPRPFDESFSFYFSNKDFRTQRTCCGIRNDITRNSFKNFKNCSASTYIHARLMSVLLLHKTTLRRTPRCVSRFFP